MTCKTCDDVGLVAVTGPAGVPHTDPCPACSLPPDATTTMDERPSLLDCAICGTKHRDARCPEPLSDERVEFLLRHADVDLAAEVRRLRSPRPSSEPGERTALVEALAAAQAVIHVATVPYTDEGDRLLVALNAAVAKAHALSAAPASSPGAGAEEGLRARVEAIAAGLAEDAEKYARASVIADSAYSGAGGAIGVAERISRTAADDLRTALQGGR